MPYRQRERSEGEVYHVTMRGTGRQLIFEDAKDRERFLEVLARETSENDAEVLAWCLMGNHAHILLHVPLEKMAVIMRELGRTYAMYFNARHDRVGHLLQGRYGSVPVKTDAQLLETVRYIHRNPVCFRAVIAANWYDY